MEPTRPKQEEDGRIPVGTLLAIFAACAVVGGVLAIGYSVRRQNQRVVALVQTGPKVAVSWIADLQAGRFDQVRKLASPAFQASLTGAEAEKLRALALRLGDKPVLSGWTVRGGSVVFSFPAGLLGIDQTVDFRFAVPAAGGPSEDVSILAKSKGDGFLVDGVSVTPRLVPPAPPALPVPPATPGR